ncbi:MAG: hypothetical protein KJP00_05635 [Bacteroidia bacterium]|nr:hypothetical protein [Bacteroidia bacterium]
MTKHSNINTFLAIGIIIVAIISRFLPHPPNFTAIGAIGLFGAAHFQKKWMAFLLPVIALWMSDLVLNNFVYTQYYDSFQFFGDPYVYAAFILIIGLGGFLLKKINVKNILVASVIVSVVFFLVTNFGFWRQGLQFPMTAQGLIASYIAAIPFFWSTLAGNIFYSLVLFKVYEWVKAEQPAMTTSN